MSSSGSFGCVDACIRDEGKTQGSHIGPHPEHLAKRADTMRAHRRAIQDWEPSDLPAWLTRDVYVKQIQPALASVAKSQIRSALGVSEPYSSDIRAGKRIPHPRHWETLAKLAGVPAEGEGEQLLR